MVQTLKIWLLSRYSLFSSQFKAYKMFARLVIIFLLIQFIQQIFIFRVLATSQASDTDFTKAKKLYWFIPDGVRAEPYLFNIYEWAKNGELPNIKRMMDNGSYGFCKPVYPGHTPVNFASMLTGTYPEVHGVADGPMHTEGHPLTKPSVAGFRSTAKKVEPIWVTLERQGRTVGLLSVPGSTPPELKEGYTIIGRWGGWGASFYPVNFEELGDGSMRRRQGRHTKLFFFGPQLVIFKRATSAEEWMSMPESYSLPKEVSLEAWGSEIYAYIYDVTDDARLNYDRIVFSSDKQNILADLEQGEWSDWLPITLVWSKIEIPALFKIKVIKLEHDGFYRIRFFYNSLNKTLAEPSYLAKDIIEHVGPMVDYVDNFPPQLIFYEEDKLTFIEEADMSLDWHKDVVPYFLKAYKPDIFLHDTYTPNQMLTSRWWMGYLDPDCPRYHEKTDREREKLWLEVKDMYKKLDDIIGEYLDSADENTIIAVSSDHGAAPLHKWVHVNNLFARKGWLEFDVDSITGEPIINWRKSNVVYLKFGNIYINPSGLHGEDGNWHRASGLAYEKLRDEVIKTLLSFKDEDGVNPVVKIAGWEDAENKFRLPHERVGDLIISNRPGYGWNEEMTEDKKLFSRPLKTGYKQAIVSDNFPAMWCPFIIMGHGVRKNNFLGNQPIDMVDQYPTLMKLMHAKSPNFVQGKALDEVFSKEFNESAE